MEFKIVDRKTLWFIKIIICIVFIIVHPSIGIFYRSLEYAPTLITPQAFESYMKLQIITTVCLSHRIGLHFCRNFPIYNISILLSGDILEIRVYNKKFQKIDYFYGFLIVFPSCNITSILQVCLIFLKLFLINSLYSWVQFESQI